MNILDRLKEIDQNINSLEKILKKKEYIAAGLELDLTIGSNWSIDTINFGAFSNIETELLELLLKGVRNTREVYIKELKLQMYQIQDYLKND